MRRKAFCSRDNALFHIQQDREGSRESCPFCLHAVLETLLQGRKEDVCLAGRIAAKQGRIAAKQVKTFPASAGLLCKYIIKGISTEPSVAVSTSLSGQPEILLSQAVTCRLLRVLRRTPNVALCAGAKSGGEVARNAGGGLGGQRRAQKRFLGERGGRARFRKADCIRCGAGRLLGPTWRPLRLRASPRPAAEDSTAGFPPGLEETEPGGAGAVGRPGTPQERGQQGGTPGGPRGAAGSVGMECHGKRTYREGWRLVPLLKGRVVLGWLISSLLWTWRP